MKSVKNTICLLVVMIASVSMFPERLLAHQNSVSFQVFYDDLSPYGEWVAYPAYGYVWIPNSGPDFIPYSTNGHWIVTEYGWTWVSDYDWGWGPFHYGRWSYDDDIGCFLVPDTEWGPSWVVWRRAEGYYGWQPMEPGVSVSVVVGGSYHPRHDYWVFVRDRDIERPDVYRYYINRQEHERIIRNSTVVNRTYEDNRRHTTYVLGPSTDEVQKVTGHPVRRATIQENNRPGQYFNNDQLRIYRPQVVRNDNGQKPAPSKVTDVKNVRRSSERNTINQTPGVNSSDNARRQRQAQPQGPKPTHSTPVQTLAQPPSLHNGGERRQNTETTGNKTNNVQPSQAPNRSVPSQQQSKKENNVQPVQPGNPKPSDNSRREQHQSDNNVKPQQQKAEAPHPAENARRANNNINKPPENKVRSEESQKKINPSDGNNGGERRQNEARPSNDNKNEPPRENREEHNRR